MANKESDGRPGLRLPLALGAFLGLGVLVAALSFLSPPTTEQPAPSPAPPAVVSPTPQPSSSALAGAPPPPIFQGFQAIDPARLPLDPTTSQTLVGRVNSTPITIQDLTARVRRLRFVARQQLPQPTLGQNRRIQVLPGLMAASENEARMILALVAPAFDSLVENYLLEELATSVGLRREPVDLNDALAEANRLRPAGMKIQDELMASGRTFDDLRDDFQLQQLERRLYERIQATDVEPGSPGQIQEMMRRPDAATSSSRIVVRARHVALPIPPQASPQTLDEIQRLMDVARSQLYGGTSWTVVVARFSKDNLTRHRGGDLGWIDPDDMNPAFGDALRRLPVMGAPEIIRTPRGLHLVQVTDRAQGDAHLLWKRIEARRIMAEKLRQHRLQSRIERYLP